MSNNGSSSLRPAWYKGTGGQGGRGFQPPPTVTSERGDKSRSSSWGSQERRDSNKFSALQDDDDVIPSSNGAPKTKGDSDASPGKSSGNSRSEAFRTSFNRSSSTGTSKPGRSLADLAAQVPDTSGRRHSSAFEGRAGSAGRFSTLRNSDPLLPSSGSSALDYKSDSKVIRYTRERLLSLRPTPKQCSDDGEHELPSQLKHVEGSVVLSKVPQDPVCWDNLDSEEIWATVLARDHRLSSGTIKLPGGLRGLAEASEDRRRNPMLAPSSGRWQRGVALPPTDENGNRRKERDAENPNELWDDPVGGATGAAADFSAFGAMPDDGADGDSFDFEKMAEATRKFADEMQATKDAEGMEDHSQQAQAMKIDPKRPLASVGTTITSGSGDDVNVFEDFDTPSEDEQNGNKKNDENEDSAAIRSGEEDPTASSRLMKMIGVNRDPVPDSGDIAVGESTDATTPSNPWGTALTDDTSNHSTADPIMGAIGASPSTSVPLNPWGDPIVSTTHQQNEGGMDLAARLEAFAAEQNAREAQVAAEMERVKQAEIHRRRQEEAQRMALARRQAEERARQQQAQANAMQQQQQQQQQHIVNQQSQVELVLMERICVILENSWGRSDLLSILTTLHSEDSRVIPLLNSVDALRALVARSPQRVALRRDPNFAGDMAVLLMTNAQWQQQRQAQNRAQQEELQRREQQRRMEEQAAARKQNRILPTVVSDAPWFYSDPQQNIQGPFRGDEMRQWLEAGYFKGDLPISQNPSGPFHALSVIFPDLSIAFRASGGEVTTDGVDSRAMAEEEEKRREEQERIAAKAAAEAREAAERQAELELERERELELEREREKERERQAVEASAKASAKAGHGGNKSSAQLKMMLGLSAESKSAGEASVPHAPEERASGQRQNKNSSSSNNNINKRPKQQQGDNKDVIVTVAPQPAQPVPNDQQLAPSKSSAPVWGGVSKPSMKKSMSEIQEEEAQAAALLAMQRDNMPRQSSSGWANVAASGSSGWSSGTLKQNSASAPNAANPGARSTQSRVKTPHVQGAGANRKVAPVSQQDRSVSNSSTLADEFGASMSPALEKWCKDQVYEINGSNDLTLVAFCMTLDDANEIRQYLTTYLGSSPQVNNFATEFINKRGLGKTKQEEWETPGSAKKGRKKKAGGR